jgi:hypothetical protein
MAMTPEGRVKARVKKVIESFGARIYCVMPVTGGYGNSGYPDFVLCVSGRFVAIETKANGKKPTALQEAHLKTIEDACGIAIVINEDNVNALGNYLQAAVDMGAGNGLLIRP